MKITEDYITTAHLDMGKSCIRFKKPDQIPLPLIAALAKKMSVEEFVGVYENTEKQR